MAICVAVIGKDEAPLYFTSADADKELALQYDVHSSLDIVEDKLQLASKGSLESKELYLGLLYATELYKFYGYATNTKIKFIIVIDSENIVIRENEVRAMFRNLHMLYTDTICNPFYRPGEQLESKKFDAAVQKIMSGSLADRQVRNVVQLT